jgi:hypothetical protein
MNHLVMSMCALTSSVIAPLAAAQNFNTSYNPQVSLILDGQYSSYKNAVDSYKLPGFILGGEAGLAREGFALGHSELSLSANIDDKFYGQISLAFAEHDGNTETELEEAYFETVGLGSGFTIKGGRFFSSVGYQNLQHKHAWDFSDAPLVYSGLFGSKYLDDGIRVSWLAPTDFFLELGAELLSGSRFPTAGSHSGSGAQVAFVNIGGEINQSHSWQGGLSYFSATVKGREAGGHQHGGDEIDEIDESAEANVEVASFTGDSNTIGLSLVYKWAPNGNYKNENFKLQGEFFSREEDGELVMLGSDPFEATTLDGDQQGYYIQGIYQFMPQWRAGLRFDRLHSNNGGSDEELLAEAGLHNEGHNPRRTSLMMEWVPSEFSRIRVQFNRDESSKESDDQVFLQYTFTLGAHGAHTF